jgi:UDP-N-acetylglucosamine 2-epimerase (non-hydrolysing)
VSSGHVEAGLRSGNWRHPFPEEIDRRIVGRLATFHYAPSDEAAENLRSRRHVIPTHGNTVIDAVLDEQLPLGSDAEAPYGVVLLHRFEFISNRALVNSTIAALAEYAPFPVRVLVDAYARDAMIEAIAHAGAQERLLIQDKLEHREFIRLLRGAEFIVTDSGGIQEEAALYGVPTLVHRLATERQEGIGENAVLSLWNDELVASFLSGYRDYRRPIARPSESPSDVIVNDLVSRGYA